MAINHNPEKGPRTLGCEAWEAMLADALDGTLEARDAEAFTAHSKGCAGCGELLEEAKRGSEWLRFLRSTPAAPEGLLEKILAGTTGLNEAQPLAATPGGVALPAQPWLGVPISLLQKHVAESRILMTLAMAFFSIALTLNLTGVHLNQLKLSDLKPSVLVSSMSHQYFTTSGQLVRYYSNLRFVLEVESRLNEMRRDNNDRPVAQPATQQPVRTQPQSSGKPGGAASNTPSSNGAGKKDGLTRPEQGRSHYEPPAPVLAAMPRHSALPWTSLSLCDASFVIHDHTNANGKDSLYFSGHLYFSGNPGNYKPSERSLV